MPTAAPRKRPPRKRCLICQQVMPDARRRMYCGQHCRDEAEKRRREHSAVLREKRRRDRERGHVTSTGRTSGADKGEHLAPATEFQPGHELSTIHGAKSPRKIAAAGEAIAQVLLSRHPELANYPEALTAYSRAEGRLALLDAWIAEHGLLDKKGKPTTAAIGMIGGWERTVHTLRQDLGLTPRSEAELARERANARREVIDLEAVRRAGAEALRARQSEARALPGRKNGHTDAEEAQRAALGNGQHEDTRA